MPLRLGLPAPWFTAPTPSNPEFVFDSAAGRYVLMLFLPGEAEARTAALRALAARQSLFDDRKACAFVVAPDAGLEGARDLRGLRWLLDRDGAIAARFGGAPHWLLLDPTLRVMASEPIEAAAAMLDRIAALPPPGEHAGGPVTAPVLIAPRIFEPELCAALIGLHEADGGAFAGVSSDGGERTIPAMAPRERRRDIVLTDPELLEAVTVRLERRLFPLIKLGFGFEVTRVERHLVSCYDAAADDAVFDARRDNTTPGTAHRRFACSLNLNAEFEGGDLRLPEFGPATYRAPPGGAVVHSCALMGEATRVTSGRRYALLSYFYDEDAAKVREAYEARMAATGPAAA
ncbi:MAG: 2OG-Fe(II) oxygenase [Phenylobacterium sp.]|uniref:2OG-Fe(II) oxygenase family protein n=1 Tax=Phenylobacterium sp. TaxID=1871053 RepID=UPI0025E97EBD|nr:2OG-Fe(II) oxygenase [Phenylobacterium sp.]MBI1199503.1 2OG-Fe(II) oxygenase [Phenylobacterium sp.]